MPEQSSRRRLLACGSHASLSVLRPRADIGRDVGAEAAGIPVGRDASEGQRAVCQLYGRGLSLVTAAGRREAGLAIMDCRPFLDHPLTTERTAPSSAWHIAFPFASLITTLPLDHVSDSLFSDLVQSVVMQQVPVDSLCEKICTLHDDRIRNW